MVASLEESASIRLRRTRERRDIIDAERRRRIIGAAEHVFLAAGYGAASMDEVAKRARMSKKTLYQVFSTKDALFTAVIAARVDALVSATEESGEPRSSRDVMENFLRQVARFVLAPRQIALHRLVIAEARRSPELARAFYRAGPARGKAAFVRWLALQHARGVLVVDDPVEAAGMLVSMVIGEPHMRLLLGDIPPPSRAAIDRRIRRAVDIFLKGAGAR
jgi:AcrR family transcriptional regulator